VYTVVSVLLMPCPPVCVFLNFAASGLTGPGNKMYACSFYAAKEVDVLYLYFACSNDQVNLIMKVQ